jgi:transposase InsO family protein
VKALERLRVDAKREQSDELGIVRVQLAPAPNNDQRSTAPDLLADIGSSTSRTTTEPGRSTSAPTTSFAWRPRRRRRTLHHSDRGSQYTKHRLQPDARHHGIFASFGSLDDAYDNALAESFVDSFKTELIAERVWRT